MSGQQHASISEKRRHVRGLVLIELVVALAILGMVVITATALFLTTMQGQLQVRGDVAVIEGLRTGMESMAREIRAGSDFQYGAATHSATCGNQSIQFTRTLESGAIATIVYCRNLVDGALIRSQDGGATWGRITSSSVTLTGLTFQEVAGTGGRIAIAVRVRASQGRLGEFVFSASVAPRNVAIASLPPSPALDFGTGADGDGNAVAATINLNRDSVVGRANPDAVKFQVGSLAAGTDRIDLGVAPSGLIADDEVLVIGLQAPGGGDPVNVGNWETAKIRSIAGTRINLEQPLAKDYPPTTMVQRVPNYNSLTINDNQTYTVYDWTGLPGGVFFIRVKNNLTIGSGGKITVVGKGFRGGNVGYMHYEDPPGCDCWNNDWGRAGEGIDGLAPIYDSYYTDTDGSLTRQPNYGGGGGASGRVVGGGGGGYGSGAGGGNYEGPNVNTFFGCRAGSGSTRYGFAGGTYGGDLSTKLYLGSGGGGGNDVSGTGFYLEYGTAGGDGGGVVAIYSKNIDNRGEITANGASSEGNPGAKLYYSTGGGGSGGSLLIQTDGFVNRGTITDSGGAGGNAQGTGCGTPPTTNGQGGTGGAGVSSVP